MDRAREVATSIFAQSHNLTAIVRYHDSERRSSRAAASFRALAEIGFQGGFSKPERVFLKDVDHIAEFGEDCCAYWSSAEIGQSRDQRDSLLWASVVRELGVSPRARWLDQIYIVDFKLGLALNVYDDRGMDVIARDPGQLRPAYLEFNEWLLDYDREKMSETFSLPE